MSDYISFYDFKLLAVDRVFNMMNDFMKNHHTKEGIEMEVIDTVKIEYGKKDFNSKVESASFESKDVEWIARDVLNCIIEQY